ncbi:unnamed protein product [Somion occarium]|uniref:DUF218 domain-containing protein n=1 Tax=Somion occarium TaxID=3059160 RepID=A0ABP1DK99_9APHY
MASKDSMLPLPVSFRSRPYRIRSDSRSRHHNKFELLLTRARVTNLGLLLLASFATLSFLFNLRFILSSPSNGRPHMYYHAHPPYSILESLNRDKSILGLNHLVVVPGHGIWKGSGPEDILDEDKWILESHQRGGGRIPAFVKHVETGVKTTLADEHALLVFSGGQTRPSSTTTEAESYLRVARISGLLPNDTLPFLRATTEDHALDSFQNLLFSIARFHEYTGHYPTKITVVGYEMKRRRFTELHRAALRWPQSRFYYIGVDAEADHRDGERQNGYLPYTRDVYGCHDLLQSKRKSRNPFIRYHSYYTSSPELGPLFNWCPGPEDGGQTALFDGPLPWDAFK